MSDIEVDSLPAITSFVAGDNLVVSRGGVGKRIDGTLLQPADVDLTAIAGLASAANKLPYATGAGAWAMTDLTAFARTLLDDANQVAMRATLGLTPGTDVQAYDLDLASIAALTGAANKMLYATGANTWALGDLTAAGRALLDDADATAQRATLGVVIGTDVQAYDAQLGAIAGLVPAADQLIYWTGLTTAAMTSLTVFGRSLIAAADAATARTALGVAIGTDVQAYDADLGALAANATNGLWARTGAGTGAARTITGTASEITVTNGDGVSGAPTLSIPAAVTFTGKTITGGTYASPTISGTVAGAHTYSGALTLSAALTYGGITLSNSVTGTGSMVLSDSPSFSGTAEFSTISTSGHIVLATNRGIKSNTAFLIAGDGGANTYLYSGTAGIYWRNATDTATIFGLSNSGAMTYGGVTLANTVTGTGSMVLSISPTFTGTANFNTVAASNRISTSGGDIRSGQAGADAYFMLVGANTWQLYHNETADTVDLRRNGAPFWTSDSAGSLLVGTTTAGAGIGFPTKLAVDSGTGQNAIFKTADPASFVSMWNSATTGDNYFHVFYTEGGATLRGSIRYNRAGGLVAFNTTSDYRAKEDLGALDAETIGSLIDSLRVFNGKMHGASIERPMFMAHEVAEAGAAYAVTGEKDAVRKIELHDDDGNVTGTEKVPDYQQLDVSALIPAMLAELQYLRARVAVLEG